MATQNYRRGDEVCCWCPGYERWYKGQIVDIPFPDHFDIKFMYYPRWYLVFRRLQIYNFEKCRVHCTKYNVVVDSNFLIPFNRNSHEVHWGLRNFMSIKNLHGPPYDLFQDGVQMHSSRQEFECVFCSRTFYGDIDLEIHYLDDHKCLECGEMCANVEELLKHMWDMHD